MNTITKKKRRAEVVPITSLEQAKAMLAELELEITWGYHSRDQVCAILRYLLDHQL